MIALGKSQSSRQALDRIEIRHDAGAAFEIGNAAPTQARPFGQLLLRETGIRAELAQQRAERLLLPFVWVHRVAWQGLW
jgi:hypothetical protein